MHPELLYTCRDVRIDNTIALIRLTNCLPLTMTVIIGQVTKFIVPIVLDKIDNPSGVKILHAFHFPGKNVVKVMKSYLGCMKIISKKNGEVEI